jgi:tRNA1Val (adenine37-N6)-methyltransferase
VAGIFRFKQFDVDQTGCAMKINTDGVLLGALTAVNEAKTILDIGTGTGVIALMLAQRFANTVIDAVEIDETAAQTAKTNFANSPFANRLNLYSDSFKDFFKDHPEKKYDLIVSNPPFYINSLESPGAGRALAKHTNADFFEKLISIVANHLTKLGAFWLILPLPTANLVKQLANEHGLYTQQVIDIKSYPLTEPHRELLSFGLQQTKAIQQEFVIYNEPKQYSGQYQTALRDFFTIFP